MRVMAQLLLFFILAQLIGMYAGAVVILDMPDNPFVNAMVVTSDSEDPMNALFFIAYILFSAAAMIVLIRLLKLSLIFRVLEFVMLAGASSIVFYSVLRLGLGMVESTILGALLGLALSGAKQLRPSLRNAAVVMATAGVGVVFGVSLGVLPLILFLILLAIYDYSAVFFTKHMVEIADFVVKKDLAFTVTAREAIPGKRERRIDLGTGDMIAPVMLEVSTMAFNPVATLFVFIGAVVSMTVFLAMVWRRKVVLPALPPIVGGMLFTLLLGWLLGFY